MDTGLAHIHQCVSGRRMHVFHLDCCHFDGNDCPCFVRRLFVGFIPFVLRGDSLADGDKSRSHASDFDVGSIGQVLRDHQFDVGNGGTIVVFRLAGDDFDLVDVENAHDT